MKLNNNPRVWWSILFILFAFNLAVIGTLAYFFMSHRVVFEHIRPPEENANFREMRELRPHIHHKYRANIRPLNDENRGLRMQFMTEIIKAEPDYDSLAIISTKIQDLTQEISMNFYKEMIEMRKTLTAEEAESFYGHHLDMMKNRFRPAPDGEEMRMRNEGRRRIQN